MKAEDIIRGFNAAKADRTNIESTWDVITRFLMPFRGEFFKTNEDEQSTDWNTREVFDSTGMIAVDILANSIHGALTPHGYRWFGMKFRNEALNNNAPARDWLEICSSTCYNALIDSNFDVQTGEVYIDLAGYGTSIVMEEVENEDKDPQLNFQAIPLKECYFDQDHKGRVIRLYRHIRWTAAQMHEKFPDDKLPDCVLEAMADPAKYGSQKFDVVFCIFKRKGRHNQDPWKIAVPNVREFGCKYVMVKEYFQLGQEGGYYEMPAFVPRWRQTTDSKWGNSPGMRSLPDVLTLNKLVKLILDAVSKVVDPATITTERGLMSDLDLNSGGLTVVRNMDDIKPYESGARFDVSQLTKENLQASINRTFYVDQLELKNSPAMTATEAQIRFELMQRLIGPTAGRIQGDYLDLVVRRTFNILWRAGKLPPMPKEVIDAGAEVDIIYTGPMNRSQNSEYVNGLSQFVAMLGQIATVKPEVLDIPNWDAIAKDLANKLSVAAGNINTDATIKTVRDNRQKQQQQQQAMQDAMAATQAMEQLAGGLNAMGQTQ